MLSAELAASFATGLASTVSPCVLPLYPGYLAYLATLGGEQRARGRALLYALFVLAGVLTMMLGLGVLIAALKIAAGSVLRLVIPAADVALVLLGILLLLGQNPFARLNLLRGGGPRVAQPALAAYVYGLLYGPLALPCVAPLLVAQLAISFTLTDYLDTLALFLAFGLGFGVPLLVLGALGGLQAQQVIGALLRREHLILRAAGILLIALGLWDLWNNWESLQLYWA